jgi:coiled-coil domain-containing protein 130
LSRCFRARSRALSTLRSGGALEPPSPAAWLRGRATPAAAPPPQFQGSHGALGKRANKLDQGILVIRFEMPFNVWCLGCNHLVGKGVRFNAEKKQIGMYHSTRIWSFKMRTPCCQTALEVHTDPKNAEYVIVSGARR